jgi:hypothetical protein
MIAMPIREHDRPHVGEVEIDQAGTRIRVRNALNRLPQHVVCVANASDMLVVLATVASRRSFGIMIIVSTVSASLVDAGLGLHARACGPRT